ncbi:ankyrin repeat-containing domain protein [Zopfochytrium polystomum]|nr:ankyrin repeat-containing domain protein [Zopfochytrium polystomum]
MTRTAEGGTATTAGGAVGTGTSAFMLAYEGNFDAVRSLLQETPSIVAAVDEDERTLLHWAASGKHTAIAEMLLDAGAPVNAEDDAKWTPLTIATSVGFLPVVALLLARGADPNAPNANLQTPLFYAASKGWRDVCQALLENGAKLNARDSLRQLRSREFFLKKPLNQTPLHRAASRGNLAVVKLFLEQSNVKLDEEDKYGNTPLHLAVESGNGEVALLLVEAGADHQLENKEKKRPIDLAPDKNVRAYLEKALS